MLYFCYLFSLVTFGLSIEVAMGGGLLLLKCISGQAVKNGR